jgi:hypothetical protein
MRHAAQRRRKIRKNERFVETANFCGLIFYFLDIFHIENVAISNLEHYTMIVYKH